MPLSLSLSFRSVFLSLSRALSFSLSPPRIALSRSLSLSYLSCGPSARASRSRSETRATGSGSHRPRHSFLLYASPGAPGRPSSRRGVSSRLLAGSSGARQRKEGWRATFGGTNARFEERAIEKKVEEEERKVSARQPLPPPQPPLPLRLSSLSLSLPLSLSFLTPPSYRSGL